MRPTDCVGIHFAQPETQNLAFFYQRRDGLGNRLYRRFRIHSVLVENPQSFDAEIAQRILANPPYIRGRTVLFRFYLNAVYEFVPEFRRNENPVSKPAQSLADQLFVGLVSVAFGSVEKRYPALDSLAHKSHGHFFYRGTHCGGGSAPYSRTPSPKPPNDSNSALLRPARHQNARRRRKPLWHLHY